MAQRNWTAQQEQAITSRGGTLLVSAAAGSGKTAVLVERAVQLLCDAQNPVPAHELLIVTYTNAAAAELRARIGTRIEELLVEEPENQLLRRQQVLLGRAQIGTVHAFCNNVLREFFSQAQLPVDYQLQDKAFIATLHAQALGEAMEETYQNKEHREAFNALASISGRARSDEVSEELVEELYDFVRALPFPDAQLEKLVSQFSSDLPFAQSAWGKALLPWALTQTEIEISLADEIIAFSQGYADFAPYQAMGETDKAFFETLKEKLSNGAWDEAFYLVKEHKFKSRPRVTTQDSEAKEKVEKLRKRMTKNFDDLKKNCFVCTEEQHAKDVQAALPMVQALAAAVRAFTRNFYALKLENKMIEFTDLEHKMLELLYDENGSKTAAARTIGGRFKHIMVDEYQDSSEIQNMIFDAIANDDKSNLFYVGDAKQSIYGFRQASPKLFTAKGANFTPPSVGYPAIVSLSNNFRSLPGTIAGVNDIFSALMSPQLGGVKYVGDEMLRYGGEEPPLQGTVSLHLLQKDTGWAVDDTPDMGEARYVAALIKNMVETGVQVREKDGGTRGCEYGDFAILLRSHSKNGVYYKQALAELGIQLHAVLGEDFLSAPVLQPLIATLRVVDNPAQDIPLAAAMLSPLFAFTLEELTALRAQQKRGSLYSVLIASEDEKIKDFLTQISLWRSLSASMPVELLVEEICYARQYNAVCAAMPGDGDAPLQLQKFYEFAGGYSGTGGLSGFLRVLDSALETSTESTEPETAPAGQVVLMSVHKSKGLEFPICIYARTGSTFSSKGVRPPALFHAGAGLGIKARAGQSSFETLSHLAVKQTLKEESVSEEMRVLYVALTRARDHMIITGGSSGITKDKKFLENCMLANVGEGALNPGALQGLQSPLAWVCAALLRHPCGGALRDAASMESEHIRPDTGKINVVIAPLAAKPQPLENVEEAPRATADEELQKKISELFKFSYARAPLSAVPAKVSVSQIAHSEETAILQRPSFMYESGLSAAERGTALHSFLQFADYSAAAADAAGEAQRLVREGFMHPAMASALPQEGIAAFLNSPLAQRMAASPRVMREYPFIAAIPAGEVAAVPSELAAQQVLVQGIADCIFFEGDGVILVDYKSDVVQNGAELARRYARQLQLYKQAIEPRLGMQITQCIIYSFHLGETIEVFL